MKICTVCNSTIGLERLQMQPRVITCSPACTIERKLAMGPGAGKEALPGPETD